MNAGFWWEEFLTSFAGCSCTNYDAQSSCILLGAIKHQVKLMHHMGQLFPLSSGALRLFMRGTRVAADGRVRRGQWNHFLTEVGTLEEISALTAPL